MIAIKAISSNEITGPGKSLENSNEESPKEHEIEDTKAYPETIPSMTQTPKLKKKNSFWKRKITSKSESKI